MISIVIPLFNEQNSLEELSQKIKETLEKSQLGSFEVLFVDDGSTDQSWDVVQQICKADGRFKGLRFRRNFGKAAGLSAGFRQAKGRYVITMDADLQDDPAEIPRLIEKLESGFDCVSGWKQTRYDP
ncbi:MAG: glycosyltransferase family 2 protein, partial [Pirellula sp.]|nr:glycosyltransferase family 2 protein [Pirellula sp.]